MRTTNFEHILSLAPLDAKAAMVVSQKGAHWTPDLKSETKVRSDCPLATKAFPGLQKDDRTGQRHGRMVVIGYAAEQCGARGAGARWVVRCVCGTYEHRRRAGMRCDTPERPSMCSHCDYLRELKAGLKPMKPLPARYIPTVGNAA